MDGLRPPEGHPNRPVLTLSFALNKRFLGDAPASFRGMNLAIHVAAALPLLGLVRRTLQQRG